MTIELSGPWIETALFSNARAGVMFMLCNFADEHGECFPSYDAIALGARCDRRSAIREVKWLAARGLIEVMVGDDRPVKMAARAGRANVYRVNMRFVRVMASAAGELKDAVGRQPAKRCAAARAFAARVEALLESEPERGADSAVDMVRAALAKGDTLSLLPEGYSDTEAENQPAEGDTVSPNTSSHPTGENPSRAREASLGENRKARPLPPAPPDPDDPAKQPVAAPPEWAQREAREDASRRRIDAEARLIAAWLAGMAIRGAAYPEIEWLGAGTLGPDGRLTDAVFACSLAGQGRALSWVDWCRDFMARKPGVEPPKGPAALVLADLKRSPAGMSARIDDLRDEVEARRRARDGPGEAAA